MNKTKLALHPPKNKVSLLNKGLIQKVIKASKVSPRKRMILPFHKTDDASLHRMFNAMQPGSYFRPHHHLHENKSEAIIVLNGALRVIIFDNKGAILEHYDLKAGSNLFGIDIEPDQVHTLCVLEEDTVIFEVKPGPYVKHSDKAFMAWAPEEKTPEAESILKIWESL